MLQYVGRIERYCCVVCRESEYHSCSGLKLIECCFATRGHGMRWQKLIAIGISLISGGTVQQSYKTNNSVDKSRRSAF